MRSYRSAHSRSKSRATASLRFSAAARTRIAFRRHCWTLAKARAGELVATGRPMTCLLPGLAHTTPGAAETIRPKLAVFSCSHMAKAWRGGLDRLSGMAPEAVYASAAPGTAPSKEICRVVQVVSTPAFGGHFPASRVRPLHVADAIDDLSLDRVAFPAQVRHVNGERAVAHGSGAALGELVQELSQGPPVMRACSEDAKNYQFLVGRRVIADWKQPSHAYYAPDPRDPAPNTVS